jgi:hypothetical protein
MKTRMHEEQGVALVTGLLISMVVLIIGTTTVALSMHNTTNSSRDRKRVQAIDAAEAGINITFNTIGSTATESLPCALEADLGTDPPAHYLVEVDYYATYPPSGDPLPCPLAGPPADPPAGAALVSTGTAVQAGSSVAVSRTMETAVRVAPILKPYGQAIFANNNLTMYNNLDVNGYQGNDGDIYTNGSWTCDNSSFIRGSVIAQTSVTMDNSCTVAQDVYARNAVSMSGSATVQHDVISATSSITMNNNTKIHNDATAGTSCAGCDGKVTGAITTNHMSPPPPVRPFPVINYAQASWESSGYSIATYSDCASAKAKINDTGLPAADWVVRVSPACALTWGNGSTINIRGNLAIITDGSITTLNQTKWRSTDGQSHVVYFIVPYTAGAGGCSGGAHDISMSNNTSFERVQILVYSPCTVTMNNNNIGQGGQIFGGNVNIVNHYSLTFRPILIPGAGDVAGYTMDIAYLREVINP